MGFHFHNKETEVIKVENGKTLTKRTSDHVIDIQSGILVLATLILVGAFLEYQGEWLSCGRKEAK